MKQTGGLYPAPLKIMEVGVVWEYKWAEFNEFVVLNYLHVYNMTCTIDLCD